MNNFNFLSKTPKEIDKLIAARIRNISRRRKISQKRRKVKYHGRDVGTMALWQGRLAAFEYSTETLPLC